MAPTRSSDCKKNAGDSAQTSPSTDRPLRTEAFHASDQISCPGCRKPIPRGSTCPNCGIKLVSSRPPGSAAYYILAILPFVGLTLLIILARCSE